MSLAISELFFSLPAFATVFLHVQNASAWTQKKNNNNNKQANKTTQAFLHTKTKIMQLVQWLCILDPDPEPKGKISSLHLNPKENSFICILNLDLDPDPKIKRHMIVISQSFFPMLTKSLYKVNGV